MASLLIITNVENLQNEINQSLKNMKDKIGIYVSLNKTQKSVEQIFSDNNITTDNLFFIDCVTSEKTREDVLHVNPDKLDILSTSINSFIKEIEGSKFLIIDALSTLLIFNRENNVAQFVKELTNYSSRQGTEVIAFSPATQGEELLNKIFNFFDKVEKR